MLKDGRVTVNQASFLSDISTMGTEVYEFQVEFCYVRTDSTYERREEKIEQAINLARSP
jgi:hypothetical protein